MNLEVRVHRHIGFFIDSDAKLVALKCRKFVGVRSLVMNTLLNRIILKKKYHRNYSDHYLIFYEKKLSETILLCI